VGGLLHGQEQVEGGIKVQVMALVNEEDGIENAF
jgi:hypothetical protein